MSYFDNGLSGIEVLEENNYYPFGLKHEGYNALAGNPSYQYKYNGKELQETGMYDYGARFYMPDIGRWGVVDSLAEKMTRHSPYNYASLPHDCIVWQIIKTLAKCEGFLCL
nr:RHS repeat-associated core domain-containing protein [Chryseobacterium sp. LJ756]